MKKFKATKLILSGVALAATAATLSSTTYAWYVSNQTATADGLSANTAAAGTDGSVYISKDGENFFKDVTFVASDFNGTANPATYANNNKLGVFDPVTTKNGETFYRDVDLTASPTEDTGHFVTINMWVQSEKAIVVQPTLLLTNTTTSMGTQTAYQSVAATGKPGATAGQQFSVDAANALNMKMVAGSISEFYEVAKVAKKEKTQSGWVAYTAKEDTLEEEDMLKQTVYTYTATTVASATAFGSQRDKLFAIEDGTYTSQATAEYDDAKTYYTRDDGQELEGAHLYYRQVMGESPKNVELSYNLAEANSTLKTDLAEITLTANTPTKVTFTFWLEGADISCFDSCAGQSFDFSFDFSFVRNATA